MTLKEYKQTLYQLNREKRLEQMKRLYRENREQRIEYQRRYRERVRATA